MFYVPKNNLKKTTKLSIFISEEALFFDIHDYLQQHLDFKVNKFRCFLIANNECLKVLNPSENIMKSLDKGFIFCCEIDQKVSNAEIIPLNISEDYKNDSFKSYPRSITANSLFTLFDLKICLYKYARRFFEIPKNLQNFGEKVNKIINEIVKINDNKEFDETEFDELIKEEYFELFEPLDNINNYAYFKVANNSATKLNDEIRKEIINNFPLKFYFKDSDNKKTIILNKEFFFEKNYFENFQENSKENTNEDYISKKKDLLSSSYPDFSYCFESTKSFEEYLRKIKSGDLSLIAEIDFENLDQVSKKALVSCKSVAVSEKTKNLTLEDCLNHFKLTEKLGKNNEWYCSVCKKHQKAFKKLELYYTPRNLIIHLKRFEYTSVGRYSTYADKIGKTIDFPLTDMELGNYIIGPHNEISGYDLYAVSQHFGGVGGGHYTAVCRNSGKWYDFNDSHCGLTSSGNVVSGSAYMLFYKKKEE